MKSADWVAIIGAVSSGVVAILAAWHSRNTRQMVTGDRPTPPPSSSPTPPPSSSPAPPGR